MKIRDVCSHLNLKSILRTKLFIEVPSENDNSNFKLELPKLQTNIFLQLIVHFSIMHRICLAECHI